TDALYGALGVVAAPPGERDKFTFGNERYQYYERVAGGSGAGPGFEGADVVQTHMTNSRLTDPEVLEWRFPVLLESFAIRPASGGRGRRRGGRGPASAGTRGRPPSPPPPASCTRTGGRAGKPVRPDITMCCARAANG